MSETTPNGGNEPTSSAETAPPAGAETTAPAGTDVAAPTSSAAASAPNSGPLGQERGVGFAVVMSLVTLGIYAIYWLYKSFSEVKNHRGEGLGGIVGVLLCFVVVGYFLLSQSIGRMYGAEGNENPPVSGLTGIWVFVPYVGGLIYIAKIQGALNEYWKAKGAGTVATAATTSF
jgi:hypothetical protein